MTKIPDVSWSRVAGFVRQHTHDLRNELNGLDLEAALLADIVTDPEAREGVARMRVEIRKVAAHLRSLSAKFAEPRPSRLLIAARELFLIWQDQVAELPGLEVEWASLLGEEQVNVDPAAIAQALRELFVNAEAFRAGGVVQAAARVSGDTVIFELREPKTEPLDPAGWGRTPLASTRRAGYGLGLCVVLRTIEANEGTVSWRFDAGGSALITSVTFPTAPGA